MKSNPARTTPNPAEARIALTATGRDIFKTRQSQSTKGSTKYASVKASSNGVVTNRSAYPAHIAPKMTAMTRRSRNACTCQICKRAKFVFSDSVVGFCGSWSINNLLTLFLPLPFISHDVFAQSVLCKHFGKVIDRSKVLNRIIW